MLKRFFCAAVSIIVCSSTLGQISSMSYANFQISKNKIGGDIEASSNGFSISLPINETYFMTASYEDGESDDENITLDGIQFGLGHIKPLNDLTDFVSYIGFGTNTADFDNEDLSADIDTRIINVGIRSQATEKTEIQFFISNTDIDIDTQGNVDFYYDSGENTSIDFSIAHYYQANLALIIGVGFDRQGEDVNLGLRFDL
jgi:hypothetical protein